VESVAWASERKDVLGGFFFMLCLCAYSRYARKIEAISGRAEFSHQNSRVMLAVVSAFALGLGAKSMLVSLPLILLLLDYWPLRRSSPRLLVLEKTPLILLAAACCLMTLAAQEKAKALTSMEAWGLPFRIANACESYVRYLIKSIWPRPLLPFYPLANETSWVLAGSCLAVLFTITAFVVAQSKQRPFLMVGWLWYIIMLVPVIGIVQVGAQAMADRYTYLPMIGVLLMAVWLGAEVVRRSHIAKTPVAICTACLLAAYAFATIRQLDLWHDSRSLWEHTAKRDPLNYLAHDHLGMLAVAQGRLDEASAQFSRALQIKPDYDLSHSNLGQVLADQGKLQQAQEQFELALRCNPNCVAAHVNLGTAYARQNSFEKAHEHFQQALSLDPAHPEANYNMAMLSARNGQLDDALTRFRMALAVKPDFALALHGLGTTLVDAGMAPKAVDYLRQTVALQPERVRYQFDLAHALQKAGNREAAREVYGRALGLEPSLPAAAAQTAWKLATDPDPKARNGKLAVRLAEEACESTDSKESAYLDALSAAYAEEGRYVEAMEAARLAIRGCNNSGEKESMLMRLHLYEKSQPFRQAR
jgi:tetratricopeptide (TPR) repeat protein